MSSNDIKAKEGDLVNPLCSAQGELKITFSWKKDQKTLESLSEIEKPPGAVPRGMRGGGGLRRRRMLDLFSKHPANTWLRVPITVRTRHALIK